MVKDLTEKDLNQDRRIENLEKVFKINYDFYTGAKAKKTRDAQNSGSDHPNVEGIDAKKKNDAKRAGFGKVTVKTSNKFCAW